MRNLGLRASFSRSMALSSASEKGGAQIDGAWTNFDVGLRLGMPSHRADLGASLSYGGFGFSFEQAGASMIELPDVDYRFFRAGGDLQYPLGRFRGTLDLGYRFVLSEGVLDMRFPHSSAAGVDAAAGLAMEVGGGFAIQVTGQYVRMFFDLQPQPGDVHVAGGALDQVFGVRLATMFTY
jgi:hypothetical protein